MPDPITFYNRSTREMQRELVLGDSLLRLAYSTPARHLLSWPLFGTALCSRLLGWYATRGLSKGRIERTVRELKMELADYEVPPQGFASFNEFFARRLKPGARPFAPKGLCSPADSRLLVYPKLEKGLCIPVKGASFTVEELLGSQEEAAPFEGGSLFVFRLCPSDYHRFHFPDDGTLLRHWRIPGKYHSVNPLALEQRIKVFTTNVREISILELAHFGKAAFIEVGAFGVASITQTHQGAAFKRGDEKGYFTFGGSTVIMIFGPGRLTIDSDILSHSDNGVECLVKAGEHVASSLES